MTRVTMTLEDVHEDYAETLRRSSWATEHLKDVLGGLGFQHSDLKTLKFDVDTEYESYKVGDEYKTRFVGYKFEHIMKVEFDSDNERLGKVLYALAHCLVRPEFRIGYTVRDREAVKNELLGKAIYDAREKASVLAKAAGVILKDIQSIDYSWGEFDIEVHPTHIMYDRKALPASSDSYDIDIEPDDVEVSDTVTVIWEIA